MKTLLFYGIRWSDAHPKTMLTIAGIWIAIASTLIRVMG